MPGHEGLVHNMLAGATGIDFVMLVVAADDGVMPQTREHLAIMDLLGLTRGVVALNKADLVSPDRLAAVTEEIEATLAGTGLEGAEILPVSAITGAGINELIALLDRAQTEMLARKSDGAFRLFVDRVFTLAGHGTVVTGTVASGLVRVDDQVVISPSGLTARVRSIHAQNRPVTAGSAGRRCALVLAGTGITKETVKRGDAVLELHLHAPSARIDADLHVLRSEIKPIGQWMPVRVHHGAAEVGGRIVVLSEKPIAPGASDFVQLVLERPVAVAAGDRFIVRDTSARRTIGGGTLLDLRAPDRRRRTPQRRAELAILTEPDPAVALEHLIDHRLIVDVDAFTRDHGLPLADADDFIELLSLVPLQPAPPRTVMSETTWQQVRSAVGAALDAHHAANPDLIGLTVEVLRRLIEPKLMPSIFTVVLQKLAVDHDVALDRGFVRRPSHTIKMSLQDTATWSRIRPLLSGAERFRPPRVRDMVAIVKREEPAIRRLMQLAAKRGETEEIAKDHFFLVETVAEMAAIARQLDKTAGAAGFSAADFRDRLDNGRKVAIQILEHFDKRGFTVRRGDARRINPHKAGLYDKM